MVRSTTRTDRLSSLIGAVALLLAAAFATACYTPPQCSSSEDCFDGETCVDGTCRPRSAPPDGSRPSDGDDAPTVDSGRTEPDTATGSCSAGETRRCGTSVGICNPGRQFCEQGTWSECRNSTGPSNETCDGEDNDCDGEVDEGVATTYYRDSDKDGFGDPEQTRRRCSKPSGYVTRAGDCDDEDPNNHPAAAERCDGFDNDCDGRTDEEIPIGNGCAGSCECGDGICIDQTCSHRVFVTSETFRGKFSDGVTNTMDRECNQLASDQNLGGTWKAIASTRKNKANNRVQIRGPVYDLCGSKVVESKTNFWTETHLNPIDCDETGSDRTNEGPQAVWTGTNPDGTSSGVDCGQWLFGSKQETIDCSSSAGLESDFCATVGNLAKSDAGWLKATRTGCGNPARLYCIDGQ